MTRSAEAGGARARAAWLLPLAAAAGVAFLLWSSREALLGTWLTTAAASPEAQVQAALAGRGGVIIDDVDGAGGRAELSPVRYADVAVQVDAGVARVLAMVEARGVIAWRGERADLGYVGRESFAASRCAEGWCPRGPPLPALQGVLAALRARSAAAAPAVRVLAWQIRVERDRATAGEDYALAGAAAGERRRALHALRRDGERWVVVAEP